MNSNPDKLVPAVIGGTIIGVISAVPGLNLINCFCCAGIILGGFFAVFFYNKTLGDLELTYSDGALVGILAGIFGVIIGALINSIIGTNIEQIIEQVLQYAEDLPPEAEDILLGLKENSTQLFILNIAFGLVINIIFGLIGGVLGVAILGKKK
ncbi:MAG: hypothetical protein JSW07_02980 [bacterium]|nr:MAG: hypothetical protein JSW07_02980 [bacterium]